MPFASEDKIDSAIKVPDLYNYTLKIYFVLFGVLVSPGVDHRYLLFGENHIEKTF